MTFGIYESPTVGLSTSGFIPWSMADRANAWQALGLVTRKKSKTIISLSVAGLKPE
jgi:hypothetical protein